jgi:hypothetical protein
MEVQSREQPIEIRGTTRQRLYQLFNWTNLEEKTQQENELKPTQRVIRNKYIQEPQA